MTSARAFSARAGWLLAILLGVAACADPVGGQARGAPVPVLSAGQSARQSLTDLAEAGVVHYQGTLTNPDRKQITLDVNVTATGEAGGTIAVGGQQGRLEVVDGTLYVDAPAQFWSLLSGDPGTEAAAEDSRWVKLPAVAVGLDIGVALRPNAFASALTDKIDNTTADPLTGQPTTTVHGVRALQVGVGDGVIDLAAAGSHGVLHVTLPSGLGTARDVSLDLTDGSGGEAGVYHDLSQQSIQLNTAVDTSVDIVQRSQNWGSCTAAACSVIVTFANGSSVATKVVVAGTWTGDGRPAGTCRVVVGPVGAGRTANATCTDSTPQWKSFFTHAHSTAGQHPYEVDWTAEALAAPPNLGTLTNEATAAGTPSTVDSKRRGTAYVYVIDYQDATAHPKVWKYGVTNSSNWRASADGQLAACRSVSRTSCTATLVTAAPNRPSADALVASLVAKETTAGGCPPGQWVDCAPTTSR
ncbi:MAG TPA: hypothetical protein VHV49_01225 [Pseudonocardiaceae bacterium]|nr:hypothetical protein [Pseudonocardiaceae bacterium]